MTAAQNSLGDRIAHGTSVIRDVAHSLPESPGVYRMIGSDGTLLYVGKARALKRRVMNYTQTGRLTRRLIQMVSETDRMEVVETATEVEALLLESNLIKRLKPRYNILLRDDKSFPHLALTLDHDFPMLAKHRGPRKKGHRYFGPFASAGAVNRVLTAMHKAFLLRTCSDSIFSARSRPCLQYQIKRCTAPCVGKVSAEEYADQVRLARDFLAGKSREIQADFARRMEAAAEDLDYETAARYRDRLRALTYVQQNQSINIEGLGDADVLALHRAGGQACVQIWFFRAGQHFGNHAAYPRVSEEDDDQAVMTAFIAQFYDTRPPPPTLLLSTLPEEAELLEQALGQAAGYKVRLHQPQRGAKRDLIDQARHNAEASLARHMSEAGKQAALLDSVAELFGLEHPPERIEVYDNSHIQGAHSVGGMIVAGPEGLLKKHYRQYNIKAEDAAGDDFAMMEEVLTRRFKRAIAEDPDRAEGQWPDLVLIDGGKGQLTSALKVLEELGVDNLNLAAIGKGPDRNAGRETFYIDGQKPFQLPPNDPVLYYLQRLRDEAHRFAIGTHRARRQKAISNNPLDDIPGIGAKRKRALMHHFGSARAVTRAGVRDLAAVDGISQALAQTIYEFFNQDAR
ncbi:MAG: excinuclease ABC subunit UvrC [Alphaproteobacteria bacterium]